MELQPIANVARIAQLLVIPQADAIALWRDVQEDLREALSLYVVAEAVKGCVQKNPEAKIRAQDVVTFIVAERAAQKQALEAEKKQKEYEGQRQIIEARQAELRKFAKKSSIAVAVAKSEKKYREVLAKKANHLVAEKIHEARIAAATLVANEKDTADKILAASEQARAAAFTRAADAEKRAVVAENALDAERAMIQNVRTQNQSLQESITDVKKKLAASDKALAAEKVSTTSEIAVHQKNAENSQVARGLDALSQPTRARLRRPTLVEARGAEIRHICKERNIEKLFHFTHLDNLRSILTNGLLGRSLLEGVRGQRQARFNDPGRYDGQKNAVCLSIGFPTYEMFYKCSKDNQASWVILILEPSLLWELDCAFCRENAASGAVSSIPLVDRKQAQSLREMFMDFGNTRRADLGIPDDYPTHRQAEVLVCESIPSQYIKAASFFDVEASNQWLQANPGEHLKQFKFVGGDDYFKPRSDWNRWAFATSGPSLRGYRGIQSANDMDDPFADN